MANDKYLGINFPFTAEGDENFFVDMEKDPYQEIKSDLTHLLFTPIGQRIRKPNFGSKLIEYVFEQEDSKTYTDIKLEMQECIKKYFPGITILELTVVKDPNVSKSAIVNIKYEIDEGIYKTYDSITMTI